MLPEVEFWMQLRRRITEHRADLAAQVINTLDVRRAGQIDGLDWVLGQAQDVINMISGDTQGQRSPQAADDGFFDE
ncbi:MAG: hypothetical protein KGL39_03725 [Patescibacteria group bacterium]|nr:hypothetical protein [Patescibacteria group bacterium]